MPPPVCELDVVVGVVAVLVVVGGTFVVVLTGALVVVVGTVVVPDDVPSPPLLVVVVGVEVTPLPVATVVTEGNVVVEPSGVASLVLVSSCVAVSAVAVSTVWVGCASSVAGGVLLPSMQTRTISAIKRRRRASGRINRFMD